MASTYTPLGVELQATGENAGTWGTKTNTNLQLVEQILGGFTQQSIAGGAQTTALSVSDGSTGATLAHRMIELTGSITGSQIVTIPLDVQTFYIIKNSTSGAQTVQFKYASGSGSSVTFATTDKGTKVLFAKADDGTNPNIEDVLTNLSTINLVNQNEVRFEDASGGEYVALKAPTTVSSNLTFTLPSADGTNGQALTTNGSGVLAFSAVSTDLVNDTTPQLGGALDINSQEITGSLIPSANDTHDLGSTSKVWRNIYTGDLNLNNEAKGANDIDGTTGSWTIQEGSKDLFLINRKSGKKYKFKIEEI